MEGINSLKRRRRSSKAEQRYMRLSGKIAIITGGSRGIGRAVAVKLAEYGVFIYVNYLRNESAALETLRMVKEKGGDGKTCPFDVSNFEATRDSVGNIVKEKGRVDILINNAGISLDGLMARMKEEDWDRLSNTNLKGVFNCCQAVTKYMMK